MKLTVLVDNNTLIDRYFTGEPGLSYLIETNATKILFDVGYSDVFLKNAAAMGISLLDVDYLVLSHGHLDHTWGLGDLVKRYTEAAIEKISFKRPTIVAHPLIFETKKKDEFGEFGSMMSGKKLSQHFDIKFSKGPYWITEELVFLGEIERKNDFEARGSMGTVHIDDSDVGVADYLMEDSALIYKSGEGLVVITGCSHSGICNIVEYARAVCGEERVVDIIGGFHLQEPPKEVLEKTCGYMKQLNPREVHACHCTDLQSKIALAGVVNVKEVGVGLTLEF
ncbi:MAG: MBL fold metallo-hydrolase [bacterium]|nr:MBL fold metallo-hydrolase [bacterium]